jgi:hypothetical protein
MSLHAVKPTERKDIMRRLCVLGGVVASLAFAAQAAASTTTPITMKFNEPVITSARTCPIFPNGFCGSGTVMPFGHATETILFGGGCGGTCDLRTINVAGGSFTSDEFFLGANCHVSLPNPASPCLGDLSDTIISGTGAFTGASGGFTGTVLSAALANSLHFSGSITVP